jgi:DNA-binding NtrC family response regulator
VLGRVAHVLGSTLVDLVRDAGQGPALARPASRVGLPEIVRAITELPDNVGSKVDAAILATVRHAMEECGGNQSGAARLLGMERKAFVRRMLRARRKK